MIKSKKDLRYYIADDLKIQDMRHSLFSRLTGGENWHTFACIKTPMRLGYLKNKEHKNVVDRLCYAYYIWKHRKNRQKCQLYIDPNVFGPGLYLEHPGFRRVSGYIRIGNYCVLLPNILSGRKSPAADYEGKCIVVANCYIGTGCNIMELVKIGNNVTIGAGSVVTKDIPDNAVAVGDPAKVISIKQVGEGNLIYSPFSWQTCCKVA